MSVIRKKIYPEYFELIKTGKKKFEIRVADFKLNEGDVLVLEEYNPQTQKYSGRKIEKRVCYLLKYPLNIFDQKKLIEKFGLYAIGLEDI
jgi:ASC-1-like (ASCH) protein